MKKQLREQVNRVRRSQDARALVENFISLSILKALAFVLPLVTLPYLSRVIGVARFGDIAFASSIIVYFMTITDYGFNYTATRDLSKNRTNLEYVRHLFWNVLYTKMVLLTISVVIFAVLVEAIPFLREYRLLLWLTFLTVPSYMLFPEWFFQGIEKMRYITIVNVISKVVFTALIFLLIRQESDYVLHPALNAFGFLVAGVVSQVIILRKYKVYPVRFSWRDVKQTLRSGWDVFLSLIAPNLYTNMSTVFLQTFHGSTGAGLFSSGRTFVDISDQFAMVLSRVFFPFLSRRPDKHKVYKNISFMINVAMAITLFLSADLLINIFYTEEFRASANVLRIMAICPLFLYLMNAYGTNYLVVVGEDKLYRKIVMWCSILGLPVAYFFAKEFGYIGAAWTFTTIWGVRGFITWLFAKRITKQRAQ
ncbi:flippase [Porphyromonas levii]|uniref:flippase n=1 Tax=Porphyromonas levii TaxID=28114 RepID=UPI001B8B2B76|nr:flippase [Porphyromonas levii]MBR8759093.1 putative O-antigen transporter [Porphyromonas levii]